MRRPVLWLAGAGIAASVALLFSSLSSSDAHRAARGLSETRTLDPADHVRRDGRSILAPIATASSAHGSHARPSSAPRVPPPPPAADEEAPADAPSALLGLGVEGASPHELKDLGLPDGMTGVVVKSVDPAAPAAEAALQPGDVIVRAQRDNIDSAESLERAVGRRRHTVLMVYRRGAPFQVVLHTPFKE